jgi:hypothetical protein
MAVIILHISVSQTFWLAAPFWLPKITTDPHNLDDVKIVCPDDKVKVKQFYYSPGQAVRVPGG